MARFSMRTTSTHGTARIADKVASPAHCFVITQLLNVKAGSYTPEFGARVHEAIWSDKLTESQAAEILAWLDRRPLAPQFTYAMKPTNARQKYVIEANCVVGRWNAGHAKHPGRCVLVLDS